jgi:hypothetical protein
MKGCKMAKTKEDWVQHIESDLKPLGCTREDAEKIYEIAVTASIANIVPGGIDPIKALCDGIRRINDMPKMR